MSPTSSLVTGRRWWPVLKPFSPGIGRRCGEEECILGSWRCQWTGVSAGSGQLWSTVRTGASLSGSGAQSEESGEGGWSSLVKENGEVSLSSS